MRQGGDVSLAPVARSGEGHPCRRQEPSSAAFSGRSACRWTQSRRASTPRDAGVAGSCLTPRATHVSLAQCVLQHQGQESGLAMLVCQSMCDPAPAANASLPTSRRRVPSSSSQNPATHAGDLELAPCVFPSPTSFPSFNSPPHHSAL